MADTDCDVLIIGAGLLGCAAARALRQYDLSVQVLERSYDVSTGISKANSGIIYAGYDDEPGSLKAAMVVRACQRLPKLCEELDVRYRRTGSLMIGYGDRSERIIRKKYEDGLANGVRGIKLLTGEEVHRLEPLAASGVRIGLFAPDTAVLDPWELCIALYENAKSNGAEFHLGTWVTGIRRVPGGFETTVSSQGTSTVSSRVVINCAGLSAGEVREMTEEPLIRISPSVSDYFVLSIPGGSGPSHVLFHEPEYKGKGLTLIPTLNGEVLAGSTSREPLPDHYESLSDKSAGTDAGINSGPLNEPSDEQGLARIMQLCREVVPDMPRSPVIHSFAAVRPNSVMVERSKNGEYEDSGKKLKDFNILQENGLFSLIGIKTPGLTCCVELGEYVAKQVIEYIGNDGKVRLNSEYDPRRRGIRRFRDIMENAPDKLPEAVRTDPDLGRIICTCRMVSESEIREAVRRGAATLDAVKRRTGVLMGPCQGSKCLARILAIMADELGAEPDRIINQ